ncbi:unnamed protein product, partial [Symbiodinium microadriaticum]
ACRQKKIDAVAEVVQSSDIYAVNAPSLPEDINITAEEIQAALHRLRLYNRYDDTLLIIYAATASGAPLKIYGGCQLSLDISSAYDHVPRWALEAALREAQVPVSLIQLVLLIHQQALVRVRHFQQETMIPLRRGLRQGCGLAPLLWALYSGWLLRRMDHPDILSIPRAATVYADDQHYSWLIRSSSDLEHAYKAIRHVLQQLRQHGLCISVDKTVILLELKGSLATKLSARYVVHTEQGPHMKFAIDGHTLLIKLVPQHTYLGAIISYHKFESATFKHRLGIAKSAFTRLRVILHNRSVTLMLRLRLWQGCVWPAILHGLDCAGLLPTDFQALQSQLIKQARSIAKSFSMLTRESNHDFLKRLKIDDPVRATPDVMLTCALVSAFLMVYISIGVLLEAGAPGGGKGKRQPQPRGARFGSSWKDNDWRNQGQQGQWEWEPRQPQWTSQQEETQAQQLSKLQAIISMLTTLVLRQEVQLSVCRQDTAYVVFIKTHGQDNLAQSLYAIGQKWHQLKQSSPEKLTAPMRSVLFQHFVETIKQKFQQMLATPSSRSHAQELGLISDNGNAIPALRWDTTSKTHVPDTRIEALQPVEIKALLDQLLILGSKEFVVTRFHGMRKLSEEYSSPTLGMFLEIGNRTSEAKEAWEILHKLNQSAAWMAGGCYLRHERMQLSALAKRLAAVTK